MFEIILFFNILANTTSTNPIIYTPINIPIGTAIIGAVIGAISAYVLIAAHGRALENREIRKIQSLIKDDLERIFRLAKSNIKKIEEDNVEFKVDESIDKLISGKLSAHDFVVKYWFSFEFNFWNAIVSSGSLIKLSSNDIKETQIIVDAIFEFDKAVVALRDVTIKKIRTNVRIHSKDTDKLNSIITDYLGAEIEFCEGVVDLLNTTDIKWLKFEEKK